MRKRNIPALQAFDLWQKIKRNIASANGKSRRNEK